MSQHQEGPAPSGPRQRSVEMGVAAFIVLLGLITVYGSIKAGTGWGSEGPMPGFFPFWIGLLIIGSGGWNLFRTWRAGGSKLFAEWSQIGQVVKVVVPLSVYVCLVPFLGIYLASVLLIAGFMRWFGRYGWVLTIAVAIGVQVAIYITFERWFLVPLPKGPIEDWLGL
jgi:putative tricarboxylic transport membrane protein